jgi:glutathione S-transferase
MLTVHHLGISQSDRIVWLCEELDVPYEMKKYDRLPSGMGPPDYKALHPAGTAPVISEGDLVLSESGAIIEYIIGRHGNGRLSVKPESANFADYLFWFHFANASMLPRAMVILILGLAGANADGPNADERLGPMIARVDQAFDMVEARLGAAPYFAGADFTAADIMMTFTLTTMRMFMPRDLAPYPNIRAYLQRIGDRPAYRRAMAKADPGMEPKLT